MTHQPTSFKKTFAIVSATAIVGAFIALTANNSISHNGTFLQAVSNDYQALIRFNQFLSDNNKNYLTQDEFAARLVIFQQNLAAVESHDADTEGFSIDLNEFADLSPEEFRSTRLGFRSEYTYNATDDDSTDTTNETSDNMLTSSNGGTPVL
jgi:hypothetical protein